MMAIDIDRLGVLLDRGADLATTAQRAQADLMDAAATAREARRELAEAEAAVSRYRGPDEGRALLATRADAKRKTCDALTASIDRRSAALDVLNRRVNLWQPYCDSLRALAAKHGVSL